MYNKTKLPRPIGEGWGEGTVSERVSETNNSELESAGLPATTIQSMSEGH